MSWLPTLTWLSCDTLTHLRNPTKELQFCHCLASAYLPVIHLPTQSTHCSTISGSKVDGVEDWCIYSYMCGCVRACVRVYVCVCVCARACVRACVRACMRARMRVWWAKHTVLCLRVIFDVLCIHFCLSWKVPCIHPCRWDTALQRCLLLLLHDWKLFNQRIARFTCSNTFLLFLG